MPNCFNNCVKRSIVWGMSIKYNNIADIVEDDGVKVSSYYAKYLATSYEDALARAKGMGFIGGVREDGKEYGMLFNSREEFDELIRGKEYPVAIVPMV